LIVLNFSHLYN